MRIIQSDNLAKQIWDKFHIQNWYNFGDQVEIEVWNQVIDQVKDPSHSPIWVPIRVQVTHQIINQK
jgi:hypothetical protein